MSPSFYKNPWFLFGIIFLIFAFYTGGLLSSIWPIDSKTIAQAGTFGDSFGILTSLFTALAFGGLMVTIWQQQEDLSITRKEIKDQHFENVLFKMLEIHASIVADMDFRSNGSQTATGRDCFPIFHKRLRINFGFYMRQNSVLAQQDIIDQTYEYFWRKNRVNLAHYFRYLYNLFKFIDNSDMQNKKMYANIIRAQLSDYELSILYYNCLSQYGQNKFKPLAIKYALFDNMPISLLLEATHVELYPKEAFGESARDI